jgi:hypothetical protein
MRDQPGNSATQQLERKGSMLSKRLREVVIIAVGAVWHAEYELYAQMAAARKLGFSDSAKTTPFAGLSWRCVSCLALDLDPAHVAAA